MSNHSSVLARSVGLRRRAIPLAIILIALCSVRGEISAAPTTYFVATTGSDSNAGTATQPFRTINRGVSALSAGDTLTIKAGTYAEALINNVPSGTSWSAAVTIKAAPGEIVTLRPSGGSQVIYLQGQSYIIFDHLILDGANVSADVVKITGPPASHHIRIIDSEVKNAPEDGILLSQSAAFNEFIRVKIHDISPNVASMHGIYVSTDDNLVESCEVYNNGGYGIHVYNSGGGPDRNVVRYNRVYRNGLPNGQSGIILSSGSDNIGYGNVVFENGAGINVAYESPRNTLVYNNTIYNNANAGINIGTDSVGAAIRNNIVFQNGGGIANGGSGSVINTNLLANPSFVNAASDDYRLNTGSPAIDAGVTLGIVTADPDGNARPQGLTFDIGAYEYPAGGGVDITPPTVTGTSPTAGAANVPTSSNVTATFSETMDPSTISGTTVELRDPSSILIGASVAYTAATRTVTLNPTALLSNLTTYTFRIKGGIAGVKDSAGNPLASDVTRSFTTASGATASCPCGIWTDSAVPSVLGDPDTIATEVGLKFRSDVNGYITGIRFYKGAANTGVHVGSLWTSTGTRLATVTFTNESATGWQTATLSTPLAITANTTYVVSYHAPAGRYSTTELGLDGAGVDSAPLHALEDGVDGPNGVFIYGPSAFPTQTFNATNYWVDVVFVTSVPFAAPRSLRFTE